MANFPTGRASFDPPAPAAERLWRDVVALIEDERAQTGSRPVSAPADPAALRSVLRAYDFDGRPIGSGENDEGQIFIEPQGFCVWPGSGWPPARPRRRSTR